MSILSTSPTSIRLFDVNIANALGSSEAATILQQLHYWMQKKKVGIKVNGIKYVYNTFKDWVQEQFLYLTDWKFRKAMKLLRSLEIVKVIRYRAIEWNQTNHYSLDYQKLREWGKTQNIEISEMKNSTPQEEKSQTLEIENNKALLYEPKNTHKEEQQSKVAASSFKVSQQRDSISFLNKSISCAQIEELNQNQSKPNQAQSSVSFEPEKSHKSKTKLDIGEDKSSEQVDYIINLKWKDQVKDLDSAGIPVNKTLIHLLKSYKFERVESAIALLKTRKREQHIPNPCGYFVSALKGDWGSKSLVGDSEIDRQTMFRHWYDLAKELGYCSSQEIRNNEQWVCISGTWEKWSSAIKCGYSLDYLRKILKRNKR